MPNFASRYQSGTLYWEREFQSGRNGPSWSPRSTSARSALRGPSYFCGCLLPNVGERFRAVRGSRCGARLRRCTDWRDRDERGCEQAYGLYRELSKHDSGQPFLECSESEMRADAKAERQLAVSPALAIIWYPAQARWRWDRAPLRAVECRRRRLSASPSAACAPGRQAGRRW